ncbi:MAG TPA: hypothetical protein VEZ12_13550 [Herpetosiphonaceae bacterium]|nr:hypothetical protein [Herpetosiphonaceae bacterium]
MSAEPKQDDYAIRHAMLVGYEAGARDTAALRERLAMEEDANATLRAEERHLREQLAALTEERDKLAAALREIADKATDVFGPRHEQVCDGDNSEVLVDRYTCDTDELRVVIHRARALLPHETPDGAKGDE